MDGADQFAAGVRCKIAAETVGDIFFGEVPAVEFGNVKLSRVYSLAYVGRSLSFLPAWNS